ncbi:MAG: DUF1415 domain-containing protein [Legionella sp.]|nr:DUF1415 domain-containing protein [Legionella sp.]
MTHKIVQQTRQWVESFIIALNLCPFAKREMDKEAVRIQVSDNVTIENALTDLMDEIELLDTSPLIETTLLVFPAFLQDFFDYLDFVYLAESLLEQSGYEGVYQIATFHPDYCFADAEPDDVTNYTNRSPFPMVHILREESVEKAISFYGNTEEIPEKNKVCLQTLGLAEIQKILSAK